MHHHSNAGADRAPRRANTPPPGGNVHGLGLVDVLRVELEPAQLPWLAAEIDVVRYCLDDELAHQRKAFEQLPAQAREQQQPNAREAEQELDRRAYQLEALAMIHDQLPISSEATRVRTASPWDTAADDTGNAHDGDTTPVAVVGPAALMTILIRGAAQHAADALAEALRDPRLVIDQYTDSTGGWRECELPRVSPAIADRLHAMATAAHAFADTCLHVLEQQNYSFDPDYDPLHADELE